MFTPIYPLISNHREYHEQIKLANSYCLNCNRPTTINLCGSCHNMLLDKGLEHRAVIFSLVGQETINYQQYLHTSFFQCNVGYQYRGIKEERIKAKVKDTTLNKAAAGIRNLWCSNTYQYNSKTYLVRTDIHTKYLEIEHLPNIDKRLLYNLTLYHIHYHIQSGHLFKSKAHFYSSVIRLLMGTIRSRHCKITGVKRSRFKRELSKHYYYLAQETDRIMVPVIRDIINSIY